MKKKKGISLMAVATGQESKEIKVNLKRGIAAAHVLAVNPTREEQNAILEQDFSKEEINYIGETTVKDKNNQDVKVPQIRISVLMETNPQIACNNGLSIKFFVNFFLARAAVYSFKDGITKVQVIDAYGRTDWVTPEQAAQHFVPEHVIQKEGPNKGKTFTRICNKYRVAYQGEENLTKFLIALINIPRPDAWDAEQKMFVMKTDPKELAKSECCLDNIKAYFEGNISEVKKALSFQKKNDVKLLLGVRTAQNGAQYQDVYTQMPLKLAVTNYKDWEDALAADKQAGRHPNTQYKVVPLEEFTMEATDYSKQAPTEEAKDPFAAQNQAPEGGAAPSPVEEAVATSDAAADPFAGM